MGYKKESKTKRGRSQDRRMVAVTSPHELYYCRKIAKKLIEDNKGVKEFSQVIRICTAFLKISLKKCKIVGEK